MTEKIIIRTDSEENLIPDKWVLGTGLSTDNLYVVHADAPLMIIQYPLNAETNEHDDPPCIVYLNGEIKPDTFNKLFSEAWELIGVYKDRMIKARTDLEII